MSIKSEGLKDFREYIMKFIDEMYNTDFMYEGKIQEERTNGIIEKFYIKLEKVDYQLGGLDE